jgi:hypothetical protein
MRSLGARDIRVLIAIGAHADADGKAFPSLARIAELASVDRCKVPGCIRRLEAVKLICSQRRRDDAGDWNSTLYQVMLEVTQVVPLVATGVAVQGSTGVAGDGNRVLPPEVTTGVAAHGTLTYQLNKPSNIERKSAAGAVDIAEQFELFWRAYPSRGGQANPKKPAREKFETAVKRGVDPELLIRAAENYAEAMRRSGTSGRFIKTAEVWLNKASWEQYGDLVDDSEPLRAGMI